MNISSSSWLFMSLMLVLVTLSRQQTTDSPSDSVVCRRILDLVFVIDGSNSLGEDNFNLMIDTISQAVDALTFGFDKARVGAALYSSGVTDVIELQDDKTNFKSMVQAFKYPDESTDTHLGIAEGRKILTEGTRRNNTPIVMMIVTDGSSSDADATEYAALIARSRGIDLWSVGVGILADMDELARISSNGSLQTFKIESFEVFPDRLFNLTREVCEDARTRPTFTVPTTVTTGTGDPVTTPTPSPTTSTTTATTPSTTSSTTTPTPSTSTSTSKSDVTTSGTGSSKTTLNPNDMTTQNPNQTTTPDPESFTELCKNSPSIGGVGYVLYPDDCTKVLQCYYNPDTNKTLVVTRKCPYGEFWDSSCMKCRPSYKVDCPYDKCQKESCSPEWFGVDTYPMEGVCGGFWSCENGRSAPKCCPPCYSFVAGYGCKFGKNCFDKCGEEEEDACIEGLGICEKIPIWENQTTYAVATDDQGLAQTTCVKSDLSIVECKCDVKMTEIFMQDSEVSDCTPYYESNSSIPCSANATTIPVKQESDTGPIVFKFNIDASSTNFTITSEPSSTSCDCDSTMKLRIWADDDGFYAQLGDPINGGPKATVLFKNAEGQMELLVSLHQGLLTLAVKHDNFQYVTAVKAPSFKLCSDCMHTVGAVSSNTDGCMINKIQVYNCKPEVSDIYMMT